MIAAAVIAVLAGSAPGQRLFDALIKRHMPTDSDSTQAVAFGDVDLDGDLDIVIGNGSGQQNRLYLNDGTGTYSDATRGRMPADSDITTSVALGDVDSDGDLDIVIGNGGFRGQRNKLYLNNGAGAFSDATATRMPVGQDISTSVTLGDVDGDADLDIVIGNSGQNRLYLNNGSGTFFDWTASRMPAVNDATSSVALGDVDGDGDLDLVVGNGGQNRLYRNNGTGTFSDATPSRMPVDNDSTVSVALGDIDGDSDLDIVIGNAGGRGQQDRLYVNNGTGIFSDSTANRMPVVNDSTLSVALGDVDRDGDLDIVVGHFDGSFGQQNRLYLNNGAGSFTDATASHMPAVDDSTFSVALGDVDRDGDLDIVIGDSYQQNRLYLNNSRGAFSDATASRMPVVQDWTNSIALGDVDRDGDLDMVVANYQRKNRLYLNSGAGIFSDATASRMPVDVDFTTSVSLGDVDGDGDLDMVIGNSILNGQNRLYRNDGKGTFSDVTVSRMPVDSDYTTSVVLGDVDRDGDLDVVIGNYQQNRLYLNNGSGIFSDMTASRMPIDGDRTASVALGDVDGDADLDIVIGNIGQNRLYRNNGSGTFSDVTASRMPVDNDSTLSVALGDVDGDADLDIVIGNSGQNRLYVNNGTGTFSDATASTMPVVNSQTNSLALGDVDRDGDLDIVSGNGFTSGQQNRLYLNNGSGTFSDATANRMPMVYDSTSSVVLGDVEGDGDLDMVIGNMRQNGLYTNLQRQLDAPYLFRLGRNYQLDVYSRYGPATMSETAVPFLSTATARIPLPPFGVLGLDITQMIVLPSFAVQQPAGIGSLTIPVPNLPALAGIAIHTQVLLIQNPVQDRLTNVNTDIVLR